jgi:putative zinc finger/helix-turn-helix YgiT family protein
MKMFTCWDCGREMRESLVEFTDEENGEEFTLLLNGYSCECGRKTVSAGQMDAYNIAFADAYRQKHELLTTRDFLEFRKLLGMSQQKFADFLSVHVQSVKRWEHGGLQEKAMDEYVRLKINDIFEKGNIPRKVCNEPKIDGEIKAGSVADLIIAAYQDSGDFISNMKVQKLLYYVQGWHLAFYDRPLFKENFEAWVFGPVIPSIYGRFKKYGSGHLNEEISEVNLPEDVENHVFSVLAVYGKETAGRLVKKSHEEDPWQKARNGCPEGAPCENIISKEDIKDYFKKRLAFAASKL